MAMVDLPDASVLAAILATTLAVMVAADVIRRRRPGRVPGAKLPANGAGTYADRDFVSHDDLVDPRVRGDHLAFNEHLHRRFGGKRFLPVVGEEGCFIAFTHATCKEVMNDHANFSSNPFPDGRLVALNTMAKADHSRVLRYVHSHYTQAEVNRLEDSVRAVIERCTDELEQGLEGSDAVTWAKRIHMASTLARLGIDWASAANGAGWRRVDEVIALNDAMVALVAPLGGVGRRYRELPAVQLLLVALGLLRSLPATLLMAWRLGPRCAWEIIRPDITVLSPPRRPRMGLWWHPELLPLVPRYFLALNELLEGRPGGSEGPLPGLRAGVASGDLRRAEALTLMVQLMVNMTSANALASLVFRLATERAAAEEAAADPERLAPTFVQEVLRLDAPLQRNPRRVDRPLGGKWAGSPMREGDQVLLFLGAANMDPAVFERPADFRLDRADASERAGPLSFGSGMHYCLGSNLVRLEMRLALECLLKRYASVELLGGYERLVDVDVGNWGFQSLGVRLHRRPA